MFPKMVVPNNHGFSYLKWSFWGVLGVPPFKETPIYKLGFHPKKYLEKGHKSHVRYQKPLCQPMKSWLIRNGGFMRFQQHITKIMMIRAKPQGCKISSPQHQSTNQSLLEFVIHKSTSIHGSSLELRILNSFKNPPFLCGGVRTQW